MTIGVAVDHRCLEAELRDAACNLRSGRLCILKWQMGEAGVARRMLLNLAREEVVCLAGPPYSGTRIMLRLAAGRGTERKASSMPALSIASSRMPSNSRSHF